jgi:TrmH family RNA methyltransferase
MSLQRAQISKPALLTSIKNPLLKEVRRAILKGGLTPDGCCVAETFHLLEEALRSDCHVRAVLAAESVWPAVDRHISALNLDLVRVPDALFPEISATETSQGVIALVRVPRFELAQVFRGQTLAVILDGIQDPGNAGAILRAAEAFGGTGAIFLKGTVSPYNPKAVRASAGSVFRVPVITGIEEELALAALTQRRIDVFAAQPHGRKLLPEADLRRRCAFIIGSEGRGISKKLQGAAMDLRIPTTQVESLNAAAAAAILLYEAARQRHLPA